MFSGEKLRWIIVGAVILQIITYLFNVVFPSAISAIGEASNGNGVSLSLGEKPKSNMVCFSNDCFCKPGYIGATCSLSVADLSSQVRFQELQLIEFNKKLQSLTKSEAEQGLSSFRHEIQQQIKQFVESILDVTSTLQTDQDELKSSVTQLQTQLNSIRDTILDFYSNSARRLTQN
eukprot:TRINITY_DN6180_c0_g1_i1.p1 TRINITY_DN6180_c0_g1~~TRINITY_DN6180_c0_g1_i1.p1  ORF type:complete len:176 (-),score=38.32 TRINITY_DN6180_c0_g1_i1:207-734(-)